jgi:hypothetical protein
MNFTTEEKAAPGKSDSQHFDIGLSRIFEYNSLTLFRLRYQTTSSDRGYSLLRACIRRTLFAIDLNTTFGSWRTDAPDRSGPAWLRSNSHTGTSGRASKSDTVIIVITTRN